MGRFGRAGFWRKRRGGQRRRSHEFHCTRICHERRKRSSRSSLFVLTPAQCAAKATRTAPRDAISAGRSRLLRAQRSAPRLQETFPRSRSHRWSRSQPFPARSVGKSPSERRRDCCFVGTRNDGGGREGRNRRSHTNSTVDEYATNGVRAQELTVLLYISAISKRDKVCQAQFS